MNPCKTVLLFGTSCNPPTGLTGHAGLVRFAARHPCLSVGPEDGIVPDEIWILPVFRHAFPAKRAMQPFERRMDMARLAFEHLPGLEGRVLVRDDERRLCESRPEERLGTIDVVRALQKQHPTVRFALLLGSDTYNDVVSGRWKESQALRARVPMVVVARPGMRTHAHALLVPGLADVSSSKVRASTDLSFLQQALQPEVLAYIMAHRMYAWSTAESAQP